MECKQPGIDGTRGLIQSRAVSRPNRHIVRSYCFERRESRRIASVAPAHLEICTSNSQCWLGNTQGSLGRFVIVGAFCSRTVSSHGGSELSGRVAALPPRSHGDGLWLCACVCNRPCSRCTFVRWRASLCQCGVPPSSFDSRGPTARTILCCASRSCVYDACW